MWRSRIRERFRMSVGLSDRVRAVAQAKYVNPAIVSGKIEFSIRVRDLITDLQYQGVPSGITPQICSAIQTAKFLRENGLEITKVVGPPSKVSPTVVVTYRAVGSGRGTESSGSIPPIEEDPTARALRVAGRLRGILKDEFAEYGGGEAFLRWIRSEDADAE
jgi:hypothetical protein